MGVGRLHRRSLQGLSYLWPETQQRAEFRGFLRAETVLSQAGGCDEDRRTTDLCGDPLPIQSFPFLCFQNLSLVHVSGFSANLASSMPMNQELGVRTLGDARL